VDQHRRAESLAQFMARADGALYAAKQSGRDRVMAAA
jgi:PleD family two-component response regulator